MSNTLVGLILGIGIAGWVYSKMMRSSGGNTSNALIVSAVAGVFSMVLMIILLNAFF